MDLLGFRLEGQPEPLDGLSLLPLLRDENDRRDHAIGFQSEQQLALVDDQYKLYSPDDGETFELYDVLADPEETTDRAADDPDRVRRMADHLAAWRASCRQSLAGQDYARRRS
jgi:arylsulfatase A-like enzyme